MKLKPRTYQIFWDVHAWGGVVSALVLYVMFFAAAFAVFHPELDQWGEPVPVAESTHAPSPPLDPLLDQLQREVGLLGKSRVAFMPSPTGLTAYTSQGREQQPFRFSAATGRLEPSRTELGTFLYSLHYLGPIPYGVYAAGVASMALFLTLVTGLLLHVKDLVRQWFQFRPASVARTWSSDMHKVLGVFGLPYQIFYAWTGAVLCLAGMSVGPTFEAMVFGGDERAAGAARGESGEVLEPTGKSTGRLPDLDVAVERARAAVPGLEPDWIGIEHVGDEGSVIGVYGEVPGMAFGSAEVLFAASDGRLIRAFTPEAATSLTRFEAWFYGLHYAQFGGYGIKFLYALLAFGTCAVIVTGNLVWLERRDWKRAHAGNRLLERLTVGWCAGLLVGTGALFVSNRLLPEGVAGRAALEQWVFALLWLLAALVPFLWPDSRRVGAVELIVAGAALTFVPLFDALTRLPTWAGTVHRGVDVTLALLAVVCLAGGARLWRPRSQLRDRARSLVESPR